MKITYIIGARQSGNTTGLINKLKSEVTGDTTTIMIWRNRYVEKALEVDRSEILSESVMELGGYKYISKTAFDLKSIKKELDQDPNVKKINVYIDDCFPETLITVKNILSETKSVRITVDFDTENLLENQEVWYDLFRLDNAVV